MRLPVTICVVSALAVGTANADFGDVPPPTHPPIVVSKNSNTVAYYGETGNIRTSSTIPSGSTFKPRPAAGCEFVAEVAGTTIDGTAFVAGQTVKSNRFVYIELEQFPNSEAPGPTGPITFERGPLGEARRLFGKFCEAPHMAAFLGTIWVGVNDPFLDPRPTARTLLNNLQLIQPAIFTNPVVDKWGGLVTRYPAWLAILPEAWQEQRSNVAYHRGWTIYLHTAPRTMEFDVNFVPNPDKPSPAFHGIIPCVPTITGGDTASFPAMPALPAQTEPGVNGACMWTPPGPGHVTIQARITYTVTLWVNGYTEAMPDYTWTSPATTYETGELSAVNINN